MKQNDQTVYRGRLITLAREQAELPDGRKLELEIVKHPGGAVVAALDADDQVCLLKQYRHAAHGTLWELPAGCIDPGDASPLATAKRELEEEAGLVSAQWDELGSILPSPGFCDEVLHLFLARSLTFVDIRHEEDEMIEVHWLDFERALAMAATGEINDSKSVAGLFRTSHFLGRV